MLKSSELIDSSEVGRLIDQINQIEFVSATAKTALLLLVSGAIRIQENRVVVNSEIARMTLINTMSNQVGSSEGISPHPSEVVLMDVGDGEQLRHRFNLAVMTLIKDGVLSSNFATQVAKIVAIEKIRPVQGAYARFVYEGDGFPPDENKQGYIEIGDQMVAIFAEKIKRAADQHQVVLTDEQCQAIASQLILMHEYGHAVIQTKKAIELEHQAADGQPFGYEDIVVVNRQVTQLVANQIAVNQELKNMFAQQPADELITVDERVASGFEMLALWNALTETGLAGEQVQAVAQAYLQEKRNQFSEMRAVIEFASSKGIALLQLDSALQQLFYSLRKSDPQVAEKCRGGLGPQSLGYAFPLSPRELTQLCNNETYK